jgi:N-acetylmuramoyl-L-alanine amidase
MGWKQVGHHILITADGVAHRLAPDDAITNGVAGYNANSLHVSYCGGINGVDNRNEVQKKTLEAVVKAWHKQILLL